MRLAKETIGVRQAALKLKVTTKYVYDLLYSGKLPARKVGRQWHISGEAVDARLKRRGESDAG